MAFLCLLVKTKMLQSAKMLYNMEGQGCAQDDLSGGYLLLAKVEQNYIKCGNSALCVLRWWCKISLSGGQNYWADHHRPVWTHPWSEASSPWNTVASKPWYCVCSDSPINI